jgi:diacylglycerol kinase
VLITESFNSAFEAVCDTISREYKINIRYAKDVSAGAVLITAIVSAISGLLILGPYILEFILEIINTYF